MSNGVPMYFGKLSIHFPLSFPIPTFLCIWALSFKDVLSSILVCSIYNIYIPFALGKQNAIIVTKYTINHAFLPIFRVSQFSPMVRFSFRSSCTSSFASLVESLRSLAHSFVGGCWKTEFPGVVFVRFVVSRTVRIIVPILRRSSHFLIAGQRDRRIRPMNVKFRIK